MSHLKLVPDTSPSELGQNPPPESPATDDRYARLRDVLSRETFPLKCTHKLIGVNTEAFEKGLQKFESEVAGLVRTQVRASGGSAHLSVTYEFTAANIDSMISMLDASAKVPDLKYML
jgi:hypothetical protein